MYTLLFSHALLQVDNYLDILILFHIMEHETNTAIGCHNMNQPHYIVQLINGLPLPELMFLQLKHPINSQNLFLILSSTVGTRKLRAVV